MAINELEVHPYLNDIKYREHKANYFENLIIGTFPVYGITNTESPLGVIEEHDFNEDNAHMRFFYGSKKNYLWQLLANAFGENIPVELENQDLRKQGAIDLLVKHKFLITDVVHKTNRNDQSASDSDLWKRTKNRFVLENRSLNQDLSQLLADNKGIKYIYFTATGLEGKSPSGWFKSIFKNNLEFQQVNVFNKIVSAPIHLFGRDYIAFFLPSPSGNWARRIPFTGNNNDELFSNYIISVDPDFYNRVVNLPKKNRTPQQNNRLTELRKAYLQHHYTSVLRDKMVDFNGK